MSRRFPNYAGRADVDEQVEAELREAGIEAQRLPEGLRNSHPEMRTIVIGQLGHWGFHRAWTYWVCEGPGIPPAYAEDLHARFGNVVRVDGHCMCPSPGEWFRGFAVGLYHVDAQEGLNALAETIRRVQRDFMGTPQQDKDQAAKLVAFDKEMRRDLDALLQRLKANCSIPGLRSSCGPSSMWPRQMAVQHLTEAIMWLGVDLKEIGQPDPYPESRDPASPVVRPPADGLGL